MDFAADKITGADLSGDGSTISVNFAAGTEALTLTLNVRLASELLDTIAALNDRAMAQSAPQAPGARAGAYRNAQKVEVTPDMTLTKLLVDFDRGERHRVGVAISVDEAESWGQQLVANARKVREYQQKQRRQ